MGLFCNIEPSAKIKSWMYDFFVGGRFSHQLWLIITGKVTSVWDILPRVTCGLSCRRMCYAVTFDLEIKTNIVGSQDKYIWYLDKYFFCILQKVQIILRCFRVTYGPICGTTICSTWVKEMPIAYSNLV